ncbi:phage virion morphogenesis protein [Marinobacter halodurans]|uniref:Phage virion morphogenesis protein n=1 Tax=Marinobacter halodurans TaxID=2528979 RepID=A0ABY1ZSW8_9GAMM|nr:phage virion morphogenesis protein [Marinobacter halodurans]TBW58553.1 phage virion morphogenesis protein [Marinobacter halodurans]
MSVSLRTDFSDVDRLQTRIGRLANPDRRALGEQLGSLVESQTRRRISEDQESPDGVPWAPWTAAYAKRRHGGHSLLQGEGNLMDSIGFDVQDDHVEVGSNLIYARIHQEGGEPDMAPGPAGIPARPYLGFSQDNLAEIEAVADRWLDRHLEKS